MIVVSLTASYYSRKAGEYIPGREMRAIESENFDDLVEQVIFLFRQEYTEKARMPLISPAIYEKKWWRKNENVIGWDILVGDIDDACPAEEMAQWFRDRNLKYIIYSSPSCTIAKQKYRIIVPLSRRASKEEIKAVWHAFNVFTESVCDPACKDASRAYYIGKKPGSYQCIMSGLDGDEFDVDAMVEKYPIPPPKEYKPTMTFTTLSSNLTTWATVEMCPFLKPKWFAEYRCRSLGHYPLLFTIMSSVAGCAKVKGIRLDAYELADIAIAFDHACGGPVESRHTHSLTLKRMEDVLRNVY